jgi:hypothetical protein
VLGELAEAERIDPATTRRAALRHYAAAKSQPTSD